MVRRKTRPAMTRLQNAKKQLSEALAALESAASQATKASHEASESASLPQEDGQTVAGNDLSALVDEISIIETKLNEAIAMIASVESNSVRTDSINDGDTQ